MDLDELMEIDQAGKIVIEIGAKLFVHIEGVDFTVNSIFVGMKANEYVIITPPAKYSNIKSKLYPGNSIIVKYLYDGTVYAFQSSIIEIITEPINVVAIRYPKLVQNQELRNTKRFHCVTPARATARTWDIPVVIFDINKKGCRFKYQETNNKNVRFKINDRFMLHVKFPGVSDEQTVSAKVKNIHRKGKQLLIGVEYEDVESRYLEKLGRFLFSVDGF